MGPISQVLSEEFGFKGCFSEVKYDELPEWKKVTSDNILSKTISYIAAKQHFKASTTAARDFVSAAKRTVERKDIAPSLNTSIGNIEVLYTTIMRLRMDIEMLLKIYNAG